MLNKGWMLIAMLAAAAGLPYLFSSGAGREAATEEQASEASDADQHRSSVNAKELASLIRPEGADSRPVEGRPIADLGEILNFSVTPAWIMDRWPRVSAALSELDLHGYRVVLVTGTEPSDVAGSLTYYFTPKQKLQRITLFGTTGDPGKLIAYLTTKHNFVRVYSPDPATAVYQVPFSGTILSELRIKPAQVLRAGDSLTRFELAMTMERPPTDGTFMDLRAGKPSQRSKT
ncbi:MAG: hypothetical protein HY000_08235, partial [Planctomycetes bacterium]|nr:hypothetical protein [Planctomycetota bacterium]